ncbi:MAG: hypothetical protein HMLIMOIP_000659 [Candidatus Nitrosomirales archaeon]|jgi:hypothetical protein
MTSKYALHNAISFCTCFLFVATLILASNFIINPVLAYASHPPKGIAGTVSSDGCRVIGGTTQPFVDRHANEPDVAIESCLYDNGNYIIANEVGCRESIGVGKVPVTGQVYEFPTPCDVPRPCAMYQSWGHIETDTLYSTKMQVKVDERQFDIVIKSQGIVCGSGLGQDLKLVFVDVRGLNGTDGSVAVTIPHELLDGEYKVRIDGKPAEFETRSTETHSEITTAFTFPPPSERDYAIVARNIAISGTTAIPEFPVNLMAIAAIGLMGVLVAIRLKHNIVRR